MIAQKEIAKALGISPVTVSRALRNQPYLAQETRDRILEKAREMGYPYVAPDKERKTVRRLGILFYERSPEKAGTFWASAAEVPRRIVDEIQKEARENHVEMLFEIAQPDELPLMIRNQTVDGVIVMGRYDGETLARLRDLPVVSVSNYVAGNPTPRIVADNFRGMEAVTEHLASLGHKKILFLGPEDGGDCRSELFRERARGYLFAMQARGLAPEIVYCSGYDARPLADALSRQRAIAVACDALAVGVQDLLREQGKGPGDCALAAFDGTREAADRQITSYAPNWAFMGQAAVDYVLRRSKKLQVSGVEVVVPGALQVRDSSRAA